MRNDLPNLPRRAFLVAGAAAGGGLLLGVVLDGASRPAMAATARTFEPNAFVLIGADGLVTITMPYIEMGQGTYTSIPMLVAEELEVGLEQVRVRHAGADDKLYGNPLLGLQITGGSTSMRAAWLPMRQAGAAARMMLVQAAASQWKVSPSECQARNGEVVHRPSGRRLKYGALAAQAAALPVPAPADVKLKEADFVLIGKPGKRLDTPLKVNGSARYGIDAMVPGMKFAALAQSPAFGGSLKSVDERRALAVKGVRQVVKLDDCVAVIADHTGAARKGLAALEIVWDDGPNAKVDSAALSTALARAAEGPAAKVRQEGEPAKAGGKRIAATYEQPYLIHAAMEPLNCTVHVKDGSCELWLGTQVMTLSRAAAARAAGLEPDRVTVHNHYLGGGFGRRLEVDMVTRAVQIARHVKGPVKVTWSREEDTQHDIYRGGFYDRIEARVDGEGMPLAWSHRITGPSTIKRFFPAGYVNGFDEEVVEGAMHPPYAFPSMLVEYVNHEPPVPTGFWRGVGPAHNLFVVESFIDELAATAGKDPVAYRSALLKDNPRALAVLRLAADKAGWGKPLQQGSGQGRGVSLQHVFGTYLALVTDVAVSKEGKVAVKRVVAAVDTGVAINPDTIRAQLESGINFGISAALWGKATVAGGRIQQSNFHDVRVLRINEAPVIETHIVASREAPGGIGEPGTAALFPSLANAVFAATGKRVRTLPIGPEQLQGA
ncbi:xanthine dehydrogenase family protein molybdopterin-binding subunit [Massilia sp. CFBP9026]|uniref:xanthine dehydrogenase family protein molybdopterin-binding subunit n=1 Tax=Massilia sp. CFBP9026 TaxID=3096536 RepID=UPI002A6B5EA9|nr:molybdopterin cofactor-binding domain-containing protein [Massilia sp. CFBP9026]MDY0965485.1 molybdopterin cofactor-binding domain-containing protein [Massilia sp. CFBP9026]